MISLTGRRPPSFAFFASFQFTPSLQKTISSHGGNEREPVEDSGLRCGIFKATQLHGLQVAIFPALISLRCWSLIAWSLGNSLLVGVHFLAEGEAEVEQQEEEHHAAEERKKQKKGMLHCPIVLLV